MDKLQVMNMDSYRQWSTRIREVLRHKAELRCAARACTLQPYS